jgi:transcriptional regulator with XRE-family HTH domain
MEKSLETVKIAVALRSVRTALGWNQQEFADKMNVAKSTIARIETLEMGARAEFLTQALNLYSEHGVSVDLLKPNKVSFVVEIEGLTEARDRLQDEAKRRSDRKVNVMHVTEPRAYTVTPKKPK